jgi:hypothetical protein
MKGLCNWRRKKSEREKKSPGKTTRAN